MKISSALLIFLLTLSSVTGGQVPSASPAGPLPDQRTGATPGNLPAGTHQLTPEDIETFLDGLLPLQLEREDIAGATVSIVKDGRVIFEKGYGYADVANKKPVSPTETLFRPGSISKLFTWTAVMQQYEQGKLDLDRDVNDYLDFKIPATFGKPITLKNIMTHTAGFEEQMKDLFTYNGASPDLGEYLKTHIPKQIFAPGTVPAYSNYATALAGYIVERVSGQPFNQYIEQHIFQPLQMQHSTFAQPLPPELAPLMSNGYKLASDKPLDFEIVSPFPAGSLSSTADDMAKFMLAHLQQGKLGDAQILKPETVELMHSRLFALDEAANAMAYGFYEETRNGHRIIGHGGDTVAFHSDLHLIPDANLGFFISMNSAGRGQVSIRSVLWQAFLNRYFPFSPAELPTAAEAAKDAAAVAGKYGVSRRADGSVFRVLSLISEATVSAVGDGLIEVDSLVGTNGKPKRWREVGSMRFQEVGGQDLLIFKPDEAGQMQMIITYPFMVFKRVGLWENSGILLPVFGLSLLVMLLALVLWPIGWYVRRRHDHRLDLTGREWLLRLAVRADFAFYIIFIVFIAGLLIHAMSNYEFLSGSSVVWFRFAQVFGVIAVIGSIVVFYNAVHAWMSSRYRIWGKLQATVFALATLGLLWFIFAGNLLSFSSRF